MMTSAWRVYSDCSSSYDTCKPYRLSSQQFLICRQLLEVKMNVGSFIHSTFSLKRVMFTEAFKSRQAVIGPKGCLIWAPPCLTFFQTLCWSFLANVGGKLGIPKVGWMKSSRISPVLEENHYVQLYDVHLRMKGLVYVNTVGVQRSMTFNHYGCNDWFVNSFNHQLCCR